MRAADDLDQDLLVEAIQSSFHLLDDAAPVLTRFDLPGLRARMGPTPNLFFNAVGMAQLEAATAEDVIKTVIDRYAAEGKSFGWYLGPSSAPADLAGGLLAGGLAKADEDSGMALTDLGAAIPANPAIRVEEVTFATLRAEADMLAAAFEWGFTPQDMMVLADALEALHDGYPSHGYLAFSPEDNASVGFSYMTHTDLAGIVWLGGAATLPKHRGRGIYRSLVARRVADAHAAGATAAVIQASRRTSAPICQRIGFTELCALELYAWTPDEV
jgi:GNAT superfamily N-acetyltransferase